MLILDSPITDPHFNIAAEEYLLIERKEDIAFFYVNEASVIVGKHQNAYAEINPDFVLGQKIPVIRRLSGGGTVWHDPGNLNFTFLLNGQEGGMVDFRKYAAPVLDHLQHLGLPASFGERNEILVNSMKVSGNAEHVKKRRVLHHGTLLFHADLKALKQSLDTDPGRYSDKAVQSVPSEVANINAFFYPPKTMEEFRGGLLGYLLESQPEAKQIDFTASEFEAIKELAEEKYGTWDWNFGYSPRYRIKGSATLSGERVEVELGVEKGRIREVLIENAVAGTVNELSQSERPGTILEKPYSNPAEVIQHVLTGLRHDPEVIRKVMYELDIADQGEIDTFVKALF